jgi:chromosome segregation ATPase
MDDAQSLRNQIADLERRAKLKRDEAEQYLRNATTYSGASQADQAASAQDQADGANREVADIESKIGEVQRRLADKEAQAADLDRQEQELRNKLGQVQQQRDSILGKTGGFGPII